MNKDEMIKDIKAIIVRHHKGLGCNVVCYGNQCENCEFTAEDIYNAGYRKIADNEIVIKRGTDIVELLNQELKELLSIADDELVIKKKIELNRLEMRSYREGVADGKKEIQDKYDDLRKQYATLWKENKTLKDDNKHLVDRNFTLSIEISKTKEETRKFLRELYKSEYYTHGRTVIEELAKKCGIETEWIEAYKNYKNELE